jgi:PilZ domain
MLPVRGKESDMLVPAQERRMMRRFDMRLPALVKVANSDLGEINTETQNVSARGVFFYLDRALPEGSRVEVTMTFPPHVTLTDSVRVRFVARVLRAETPLPGSRVGIAALIEEYEFLRSTPPEDFLKNLAAEWKKSSQ